MSEKKLTTKSYSCRQ